MDICQDCEGLGLVTVVDFIETKNGEAEQIAFIECNSCSGVGKVLSKKTV